MLYGNQSFLGRLHKEIMEGYVKSIGRHFIIDAFTGIVAHDPSVILDSFKAYGFVET